MHVRRKSRKSYPHELHRVEIQARFVQKVQRYQRAVVKRFFALAHFARRYIFSHGSVAERVDKFSVVINFQIDLRRAES